MNFDSLLNVKMPEGEIFDRAAEIIQRNFAAYKDVNICLPLNAAEGNICSIKEVKFYNIHSKTDLAARHEFMFGGEYMKTYFITKFVDDSYRISLFGHFLSKYGDVFFDRPTEARTLTRDTDRITQKLPNYEFVSAAFNDIATELKKKTG